MIGPSLVFLRSSYQGSSFNLVWNVERKLSRRFALFFFLSRSYPCLCASSFPTLSIRSSRLSRNVVNIFSPLESDLSHAHTPFAIRAQILSYSPPESIMYRYVRRTCRWLFNTLLLNCFRLFSNADFVVSLPFVWLLPSASVFPPLCLSLSHSVVSGFIPPYLLNYVTEHRL